MYLNHWKENALLEWINSMSDQLVFSINDLQDGVLLMGVVYKLREEPSRGRPGLQAERWQLLSDFLQRECRYSASRGAPVCWDRLRNGVGHLEVELSKVVLLLLNHAVINGPYTLNKLEFMVELELVSMLRFVKEYNGSFYLSDDLVEFVKKKPVSALFSTGGCSSSSSSSDDDDESPSSVFQHTKRPLSPPGSSLRRAEEDAHTKEELLRSESARAEELQGEIQALRRQVDAAEASLREADEVVEERGELLARLQQKSARREEGLQTQIQGLRAQTERMGDSLRSAEEEIQAKKEQLAKQRQDGARQKEVLREQVSAAVGEVEKARTQCSGKERQLQEIQEQLQKVRCSLEVKDQGVKAAFAAQQMDLDMARSNQRTLSRKVASLEAQLEFAERSLRGRGWGPGESREKEAVRLQVRQTRQDTDGLDDPLRITGRPSAPEDFGSSERLVAKRHAPGQQSFTSTSDLASARSNPNLTPAHNARPISMELSNFLGKAGLGSGNLNRFGYRRTVVHSLAPPQSSSRSCVGAEDEAAHARDDWMRIAELQARNKACLPHLKSSYPLESRPPAAPAFTVTDDDVRSGDPQETIHRASMMPGQTGARTGSQRHATTLKTSAPHAASQPHSLGGSSRGSAPHSLGGSSRGSATDQRSPEVKRQARCSPRPLTPKDKNRCGPTSTLTCPPQSPAERRQAIAFTITTLRSSTRKSPGVSSGKGPAHATHKPPRAGVASRAGEGKPVRSGSGKSPLVGAGRQR